MKSRVKSGAKYELSDSLVRFGAKLDQRAGRNPSGKGKKRGSFFGWRESLTLSEQKLAKQWNTAYEAVLWGDHDEASNDRIQPDEASVIRHYLRDSVYGESVLEVGAGSGRVTECILQNARQTIVLDREAAPLAKLQARFQGQAIQTLCADFASPSFECAEVSAVLLMENLAGMNPLLRDRKRIYQNAYSVLARHGIAIFAYRVDDALRGNQTLNQVMPYPILNGVELFGKPISNLYGFAVNWSRNALPHEVLSTCQGFEWVETRKGGPRPAGGRMDYGIFRKK